MQISIKTPAGSKMLELTTQQQKLSSPLSLLEVKVEFGELCEVQIDKSTKIECLQGINTFKINPNTKNHRSIKIKHDDGMSNIQFGYAGAKDIEERNIENLMHFQNSLKILPEITNNKWTVSSLFEAIENGTLTLLSVSKPLTGYDNKSLLDKLESALTQKVRAICSSPKQGIKTEELIQDVSMVKRINTNTLTHLSSHTEHWKARTLSGLVPKRLKADIIEDETNIYENLFFKMAIDDIADYTTQQINSLKRARKQNKVAIDWEEYGMRINDYNRSFLLQKLLPGRDTSELSKENKSFEDALQRWLKISKILVSIRSSSFYRKINSKRRISKTVHLTNILKNDQRYKALYDIWCLIRKEQQKEQKEKQGTSNDITSSVENYYYTHTILSLLYSMNLLAIYFDDNSTFSLDDSGKLSVDAEAQDDRFIYYLSNSTNEFGTSILEIKIVERVNVETTLLIDWEFDSDKLQNIQNLISINPQKGVVTFHKKPTSVENTELSKLVHIPQSEYRRLSRDKQELYNKAKNIWNDFLITMAANAEIHDPYSRKITLVPLFFDVLPEISAIEKLTADLFNTKDEYTCYLLSHSLEAYKDIKYKNLIRRLFNYGEAFFAEENQNWKNYHMSVLPITQTDISSIQRLMKFISLHRTKLTMEIEEINPKHCPVCGSTHITNEGTNSWKCNNTDCGIEWGKTRCIKGCQEYFFWIRPEGLFEKKDLDIDNRCDYILRKDSMFDRYVITDFEFEDVDEKHLKAIPICPKCGVRRNEKEFWEV